MDEVPGRAAKRSRTAAAGAPLEAQPPVHVLSYKWKPDNVFAAIQSNSIPATKLYDAEHTYALLDQRPAARGHCLVITKHQVASLCGDQGLPASALADTLRDVQTMAQALQTAMQCPGLRVLQNNGPAAGQTVPQLHFHIIPVYADATPFAPDAARALLPPDEAGPLSAAIQNALPRGYSGADCHAWIPSADAMEELGASLLQLCTPGTVICLNGQLGTGKTSIARGAVRAFCQDPNMFVPSPTFLLNLTYSQDTAHEALNPASTAASSVPSQPSSSCMSDHPSYQQARSIHHMDPYRLGRSDKMAGLIDFSSAFQQDICVIEWPDRMPPSVMLLPRRRTLVVEISGTGAQAAGRLVHIRLLEDAQPAPPAAAAAAGAQEAGAPAAAEAAELFPDPPSTSQCTSLNTGAAAVREALQQWRVSGIPKPHVAWKVAGQGDPVDLGGSGPSPMGSRALLPPGPPESYVVLGIESSCDDTAAAVVRGDGRVLAHKIASQTGLHEQYGGVKPDVARDAHAAAITSTVESCMQEAGVTPSDLTAVAVTCGPGLSLCLQVGVRHAMSLAAAAVKPVVAVHHMEAHALVTRMPGVCQPAMEFPALILLVSGGHNMLVKCEGVGRHRIYGTTIDDSVGEAFDKIARLLGISAIPGGPALEALAASADPASVAAYKGKVALPLRLDKDSCNFSFSGIKTSVSMLVEAERRRLEGAPDEYNRAKAGIAAVFQEVCVRFLAERTRRALSRCQQDSQQLGEAAVSCLVVAGGVAANKSVRAGLDEVAREFGIPCICPPVKYCTDNGLMVAWTGLERLKLGLFRTPPPVEEVERSIEVLPRWPLGPVDVRGMAARTKAHVKLLH